MKRIISILIMTIMLLQMLLLLKYMQKQKVIAFQMQKTINPMILILHIIKT